ncbi:MAG: hypothetical protein ABI134_21115, partial [Byssovorax sp.]
MARTSERAGRPGSRRAGPTPRPTARRPSTTESTGSAPSPGGSWDCSQSSYKGSQYWTCADGSVHRCDNGVVQEQTCQDGCQTNAVGTDDTCKSQPPPPPPPPPNWNCSNSAYGGNQYWTCSGGNAYRCQG